MVGWIEWLVPVARKPVPLAPVLAGPVLLAGFGPLAGSFHRLSAVLPFGAVRLVRQVFGPGLSPVANGFPAIGGGSSRRGLNHIYS